MSSPGSTPRPALIRGQLFLARFEWIRNEHGAASVARVLGELSPADRDSLQGVERQGWYRWATLIQLDRAISRLLAPGDPLLFERLGAASATHRTEWLGPHASLVSVHGFLRRVAEEHEFFQSFGEASYRRTGFTDAELEFSGYPEAYEEYCRSSLGYMRRAVEILTGGPVLVEEPHCQCRGDRACLFRLRGEARTPGPDRVP